MKIQYFVNEGILHGAGTKRPATEAEIQFSEIKNLYGLALWSCRDFIMGANPEEITAETVLEALNMTSTGTFRGI